MDKIQLNSYLVSENDTVVEAMKKIDNNSKGIVFVSDQYYNLIGVVTDGDIRRWLIKSGDLKGKISDIMNQSPISISESDMDRAQEYMKKYSITAVPIVTTENVITDIVFNNVYNKKKDRGFNELKSVPVVIMAGGKGTRLYPYTKILPKPLIPIGDIPIMERIMNAFIEYGVDEFYATVNYKKEMIKSYFSDEHMKCRIQYIEEEKPLGTAGSVRMMEHIFDKPFILTNCDILIRGDYADIYKYHIESDNEMTIITALKNVVIPYGVIYSSENGRIDSMEEKPQLSYFVNTGMYILNESLVDEIPKNTVFHMTDLTDKLLKERRKVGMYPISEDSFLDMGEMEEMHRMEQKLNLNSD